MIPSIVIIPADTPRIDALVIQNFRELGLDFHLKNQEYIATIEDKNSFWFLGKMRIFSSLERRESENDERGYPISSLLLYQNQKIAQFSISSDQSKCVLNNIDLNILEEVTKRPFAIFNFKTETVIKSTEGSVNVFSDFLVRLGAAQLSDDQQSLSLFPKKEISLEESYERDDSSIVTLQIKYNGILIAKAKMDLASEKTFITEIDIFSTAIVHIETELLDVAERKDISVDAISDETIFSWDSLSSEINSEVENKDLARAVLNIASPKLVTWHSAPYMQIELLTTTDNLFYIETSDDKEGNSVQQLYCTCPPVRMILDERESQEKKDICIFPEELSPSPNKENYVLIAESTNNELTVLNQDILAQMPKKSTETKKPQTKVGFSETLTHVKQEGNKLSITFFTQAEKNAKFAKEYIFLSNLCKLDPSISISPSLQVERVCLSTQYTIAFSENSIISFVSIPRENAYAISYDDNGAEKLIAKLEMKSRSQDYRLTIFSEQIQHHHTHPRTPDAPLGLKLDLSTSRNKAVLAHAKSTEIAEDKKVKSDTSKDSSCSSRKSHWKRFSFSSILPDANKAETKTSMLESFRKKF